MGELYFQGDLGLWEGAVLVHTEQRPRQGVLPSLSQHVQGHDKSPGWGDEAWCVGSVDCKFSGFFFFFFSLTGKTFKLLQNISFL